MSKTTLRLSLAILAVVAFAACGGGDSAPAPAADAPAPAARAAGGGSIQGTVSYANGDPDTQISMDADPVCLGLHPEAPHTEQVVAENGNLANVFVYVKDAPSAPAPSEPAVLDQKGCQYHPHVSGVVVGQPLTIRNSDPTLHNVHALPTVNAEFNKGQPFKDMQFEHTFDKPEVMVRFKCDVHPWMASYVGVVDHPYFAVTDESGSFTISGVPAGTYEVEFWHETLGTRTESVTVEANGTAEVAADFSPAA